MELNSHCPVTPNCSMTRHYDADVKIHPKMSTFANRKLNLANDEKSIGKILADYAVSLQEKSKLETENAILKLTGEEQQARIDRLTLDLDQHRGEIGNIKTDLQKLKAELSNSKKQQEVERRKNREAFEKYEERERMHKGEVEDLKQELLMTEFELKKALDEVELLKDKGKHYKEKLRCSVSLLTVLNKSLLDKTVLEDKGCQTGPSLGQQKKDNKLEAVEFDQRILSELFFKENPFLEHLIS